MLLNVTNSLSCATYGPLHSMTSYPHTVVVHVRLNKKLSKIETVLFCIQVKTKKKKKNFLTSWNHDFSPVYKLIFCKNWNHSHLKWSCSKLEFSVFFCCCVKLLFVDFNQWTLSVSIWSSRYVCLGVAQVSTNCVNQFVCSQSFAICLLLQSNQLLHHQVYAQEYDGSGNGNGAHGSSRGMNGGSGSNGGSNSGGDMKGYEEGMNGGKFILNETPWKNIWLNDFCFSKR